MKVVRDDGLSKESIGFITRGSEVKILPTTKYAKNPEDILRVVKSLPLNVTLHSLIEDLHAGSPKVRVNTPKVV